MRNKVTLWAAAVSLAFGVQIAWAEPMIRLTSHDGAANVEGELLGFDGETYTLRTSVGTMSIRAEQVVCTGEACPPPGPLFGESAAFAISGSSVMGDQLAPALIEGFAASIEAGVVTEVGGGGSGRLLRVVNPEGKEFAAITVNAEGTESGFQDLAAGEAVLAIAARRVAEGETGLNGLRDGPAERVVALDGIVVLVHPDNPLGVLTLDQIAAIFAGRITDWSQLGGPERLISLYLPGESSGTLRLFEELVMLPRGMTLDASAERVERHSDLADLVSIDPSGIGLSSSAFPRAARMVAIRRQCGMVSRPDSFSIKAEEYPLVRRLYLYGNTDNLPAQIPALAKFAVSDEAQPFIASAGFANRDIESQGIEVQGGRLASSIVNPGEFSLPLFREMLGELMDAQRLSLTFRFVAGSDNMEPRSQSEVARFARLLTEGAFAGGEILLVGFTDSVGDFDVNRQVAEARAGSVLEALRTLVPADTLAGLSIQVKSYGELTPVACNEISAGRELNRRVEVWVRNKR